MNTNGGMKRSRQKIDNIRQKRNSLVTKEGVEYGPLSEIEGIVADNPKKVRGDRVERLIFEEAGSNSNLIKSWIQGNALVELGGRKIGNRICGGTGGDDSPALAGLAQIFNNPLSYNVLPYKNSDTRDGRVQYTGFFIPAHKFSLLPQYLDNRGVTNDVEFKKHYEKQRSLMSGSDLLIYCAEHCFSPEEALLRQGDNLFDAELVSEQLVNIRVHKTVERPKRMTLLWNKNMKLEDELDNSQSEVVNREKILNNKSYNDRSKVYARESKSSSLLVLEPPRTDENGNVFKNLYVIGVDAIDMGTSDSASDLDVSDFCVVVKRRLHGMDPPKYVALYKARPKDIREAYEMTMKLAVWYNCKIMLEYTKISIQNYFKMLKKDYMFMARPEFAVSGKTKHSRVTKRLIGLPATEAVIKHGLDLIGMYINDYWEEICFDEMLEQMLNYSYENKRRFDIIAALGQVEIADEAMYEVQPTTQNKIADTWQDIGWYTDENGYKRFGKIPDKRGIPQVRWRL